MSTDWPATRSKIELAARHGRTASPRPTEDAFHGFTSGRSVYRRSPRSSRTTHAPCALRARAHIVTPPRTVFGPACLRGQGVDVMSRLTRALATALILLAASMASVPARAQSQATTGVIEGIVLDESLSQDPGAT